MSGIAKCVLERIHHPNERVERSAQSFMRIFLMKRDKSKKKKIKNVSYMQSGVIMELCSALVARRISKEMYIIHFEFRKFPK